MIRLLLGFFFSLSAALCAAPHTHVVRAAIDIGMGGPKLQVAEVDLHANKIVKVLHTQRYYVNFYDGSAQNGTVCLTDEMMTQGLKAFKEAVAQAKTWQAEAIVAIGAAAFRSASNGTEFAQAMEQKTGIPVHIVDQNLEAVLAFEAVVAKMDVDAAHLVVWDIGGGSMQFISQLSDGTYVVGGREDGVGAFKDFIIKNIQQRNLEKIKSPNPLSAENIVQATAYARSLADALNQPLKDKICRPATTVVGAGSVFGYGIRGMLGGKHCFSSEDLKTVVDALPGKTDADLGGGDYAFVEGSNTVLALGFMQHLGIEQMHIVNVNNADGALIYEPFWSMRKQKTTQK